MPPARSLRFRIAIPVLVLLTALVARSGPDDASKASPVALIVVDSEEQARNILAKMGAGEEFAALARQYSTDPTAKDGGYLGEIKPDSLRMELRDALQGVKAGQVSGIVKIPAGYAILKVLKEPLSAANSEADRAKRAATESIRSVRITPEVSGYGEFFESMRNIMPTGPALRDWQKDLKSVCEIRRRGPREGIQALKEQIAKSTDKDDSFHRAYLHFALGQLLSSQGDFDEAIKELETTYRMAVADSNEKLAWHMEEILGVSYLHRSSSADASIDPVINRALLFPSHAGSRHANRADADKAISHLTKALRHDPENAELRWVLNLSYMTAGGYPAEVPKDLLIPPATFESKEDIGSFPDIAPAAGLATIGNAGGVIIDDFDNDGLLDVIASDVDDCAPLRYFHNNGDGTFTDRAAQAGLTVSTGGLNMIQTDYNNDGCIDIFVIRGGWEFARRHSLLRNNCDGTFTDVTEQAGLLKGPLPPSQSAVWADIDNDGNLDLFIANENEPSQLFLNNGDGTFRDISHQAGIDRTGTSKGVVSIDYDNDGFADIYVSNFNGPDFLYHNNGNRTFTEVSKEAGVEGPWWSFGAWFFDYDNDGRPDLFVTGFYLSLEEVARSYMGLPRKGETLKLFHNVGNGHFEDVTAAVGLDRIFLPMGLNFGDIDNDGYLDMYLGSGNPSFASMLPNVLLHNQAGKGFVDITTSSGTGALAKGHGVAFGDLNNDGTEELFVVMGGPEPGDKYPSRMFETPAAAANDWITLRLVGVKSNRAAIGARIAVTVTDAGGNRRAIWRTVGSGASFGASPFQQHIGLGKEAKIEKIEIWWPVSGTKQTFRNVDKNQFLEIKEFEPTAVKLNRRTFRLKGTPQG